MQAIIRCCLFDLDVDDDGKLPILDPLGANAVAYRPGPAQPEPVQEQAAQPAMVTVLSRCLVCLGPKREESVREYTSFSPPNTEPAHEPTVDAPAVPYVAPAVLAQQPNKNLPSEYAWLRELLQQISDNDAPRVIDLTTGEDAHPLFVVAGACPSSLAPMQAVMYVTAIRPALQQSVDFWWIKPAQGASTQLEEQTLHRHARGRHKNDPGRSRMVYAPLAALFERGGLSEDGTLSFGIERVGEQPARAYIQCMRTASRYYICLIWQEDWTANPFARSKYIQGKLIYQSALCVGGALYARPFRIDNGLLVVPPGDESRQWVPSVLPPDGIKIGCTV